MLNPGTQSHLPMRLIALVLVLLILFGALVRVYAMTLTAPSNDDFNNATVINSVPYNDTEDTQAATTALDDPIIPGSCFFDLTPRQGSATVWYRYTTPTKGRLRANTFGTQLYDTVLAVWTGTRGSLSLAACNDDVSDTDTSSAITLTVSSGTTYYIEVAGTAPPVSMFRPEAPTLGGILQFHMDFIGDTFLPVILQNSP